MLRHRPRSGEGQISINRLVLCEAVLCCEPLQERRELRQVLQELSLCSASHNFVEAACCLLVYRTLERLFEATTARDRRPKRIDLTADIESLTEVVSVARQRQVDVAEHVLLSREQHVESRVATRVSEHQVDAHVLAFAAEIHDLDGDTV